MLFLAPVAAAHAATVLDQLIGVKVGQSITESLLGSPPLPSIQGKDEHGKLHFSPMGAYVSVTARNVDPGTEGLYQGSLSGYSAAVGFTSDSQTRLSYYGFASISQVKGQILQTDVGGTHDSDLGLKDMQSTALNLSLGVSYRLWSEKTFPFVVGLLAGPFVSSYQSQFVYHTLQPDSTGFNPTVQDFRYSSKSFAYGPVVGAQAHVKVLGLTINPYFLYYFDVSSPCQTFDTDSTQDRVSEESAKSCNAARREIYVDGTFYAYGLNLGAYGLTLGVVNQVIDDSSLDSISTKNYSLSYTFNF